METPSLRFVRMLQVLNGVGLLATLLVNYLANALPLNGKNTGQLSDQYPNLFTPAGLTFSIWGLIYAGLIAFAGYQTLPLFSRKWAAEVNPIVAKVGWLFCLTCLLNCTWIFAWHYEAVTLSVVVMLSFLLTLTTLNERLRRDGHLRATRPRWLVGVPFAVYWGWISIATIANITAWLVDEGWNGFGLGEQIWAVLLIGIGTLLTRTVLRRTYQWAYGLVVIWAFAGIVLKRYGSEPVVVMVAFIGIGAIAEALRRLPRRSAPVQSGKLM